MKKLFHYIAILDGDINYFDESMYLSVMTKLKFYPDYTHIIWTDDVPGLSSNEYIKQLTESSDTIKVKDLRVIPSYRCLTAEEREKWGVNHIDRRRGLAYLSDFYRFLILYDLGGVYSDLDCYTIRRYHFENVIGLSKSYFDENFRLRATKIDCVIGTQTSHRYKGTGIHFIASGPHSNFVSKYIEMRDQRITGSIQCGFKVLEDLSAFRSTKVHKEEDFSGVIQDKLLYLMEGSLRDKIKDESIYEFHLCGREGKLLKTKVWMMEFLRSLVI